MPIMKYILLFNLMLLAVLGRGQQILFKNKQGQGAVLGYASPNGNYLKIIPSNTNRKMYDDILERTAYFKVLRGTLASGEENLTDIGKVQKVKKLSDFRKILGKSLEDELKKSTKIKSDGDLEKFLNSKIAFDSLSVFSEIDIRFNEVFGYGFLDKNVVKDSLYYYEVVRVDKSGSEEYWGQTRISAKVVNPNLLKVKANVVTSSSNDSLVSFKWKITFPKYEPKDSLLLESFEQNKTTYTKLIKLVANFLNSREVNERSTKFNVIYKKNNELNWHLQDKTFAYPDSANNHYVSTAIKCKPEELVSVALVSEDYTMFLGDTSKITNIYAIAASTVPMIYTVQGIDSTNCIKISWKKLPSKPYYTGITVHRSTDVSSNNKSMREMLAQLPYQSTFYIDFKVSPGKNYIYYVSPQFLPSQNIQQESPASVVVSNTKFSKPLPPYNLRLLPSSQEFPKLQWQAATDKAFYGYFMYRGLTPNKLTPISSTISSNTFTDSSKTLSAKSTYYYAVIQQNLAQDKSDFSNIVTFSPNKREEIWAPEYLKHTLVNNKLIIEWPDVRKNDPFVSGYILERKIEGEKDYRPVSANILVSNMFTDTSFVERKSFYYRIRSVSFKKDTSATSEEIKIYYPREPVRAIKTFSTTNISNGILIKWPPIEYGTLRYYRIYRKQVGTLDFAFLKQVPKGTFEYLDQDVNEGVSYLYSVVVAESDGSEGLKNNIKSIKRVKIEN